MNQPLVSIIIPTYNRAHLIGETLDSIVAQTYNNWECIIVDDGSTDQSTEIINEYLKKDNRFQYYHRPDDRPAGGNAARNYGFKKSKGRFVNWFDSDDIMLNDFLQNAIDSFNKSQIDFVLFDYKIFVKEINDIVSIHKNSTVNLLEDYVTFKINFGTWAFVWKRDFISNIEFDENLIKAQDLDFNFRALTTMQYKYVIINKYGLLVRVHANSIVQDYRNNNLKSLKSELYARKQVFVYMLLNSKSKLNQDKCFKLYIDPFMKILIKNKIAFLFKEVFSLILINKIIFRKNFLWMLKVCFFILINYFFYKGRYRLKTELLKFKYNC